MQQAFVDAGAVQCGFCTPGLVVATADLLRRNPQPFGRRDPRGALGQPLPLHGLREDLRRRAGGGRPMTQAVRTPPGREDRRARPAGRRAAEGQGRVRVRERPRRPGDAVGAHAAEPARARAHRLDRHLRGGRDAGRARGAHARGRSRARRRYGLEFSDQPVLAIDRVLYYGEPVALVAAEHPEQARRAAERIRVEYEPLEPVADMERATRAGRPASRQADARPRLPRRRPARTSCATS